MWCESTPRTASWKPQPIASSGTSKFSNVFVRPGADLLERLVEEVQRHARRVGDEVDPRAVALDRVRPLRDLPLEVDLGRVRRLGQRHRHAAAGRVDVRRVDLVGQRRRPQPRERAAAGVHREVVAGALVVPARAHHPRVVAAVEVALLRLRDRRLVPRVAPVHRVAERVLRDEHLLLGPVLVVGAAEQDPDAEVDVDEVRGDQLAVDDDARGDEHLVAPVVHVLVAVVDVVGVVERAPAVEQDPPPADLLVARQRLVEEVEDVVVHRDGLLDEVQAAQQPAQVVGQQRRRRDGPDAARVDRGRVHVAPLHQADHLAPDPAHVQRLAVRLARERVVRAHDVRDRLVAVRVHARARRVFSALVHHARVGLLAPSARRSPRTPGCPGR